MSSPHFDLEHAERMLIRIAQSAVRCELDTAARDERELFRKTLESIAGGHRDARRLANTALRSLELVFDREGGA